VFPQGLHGGTDHWTGPSATAHHLVKRVVKDGHSSSEFQLNCKFKSNLADSQTVCFENVHKGLGVVNSIREPGDMIRPEDWILFDGAAPDFGIICPTEKQLTVAFGGRSHVETIRFTLYQRFCNTSGAAAIDKGATLVGHLLASNWIAHKGGKCVVQIG